MPPLTDMPIDGGGIESVAYLEVISPWIEGARVVTVRPRLEGGALPPPESLVLATALEHRSNEMPSATRDVRFEWDGHTLRAQIALPERTSLYGGGLAAGALLRNGRSLLLWNTDAWRYGEESPALYQSHPYALAVFADGRALGMLADTPHRGTLAFAPDGVELAFEDEPFDLHLIEGQSPQDVQRALSALVGTIEMPPLWALGYHQCRWSYMDEREVRDLARQFRERAIPCDAIWLDIDHMQDHRPFTWDAQRFPDPARLVSDLHRDGFHAVAILDPGIPRVDGYEVFDSALSGQHFVVDAREKPVHGRVWPGVCHFPDFTREETRAWWADRIVRFVLESGVDGIWNDMNEPSVFRTPAKTLPEAALHRGMGGGTHARFHNLYGQLMARATHAGLDRARPDRRPFVLTRANHIAGSRFAATWTGDNQATWEDLRWSIPMVLSLGLCGQPFSGPDIGGFDGDPDPELFARWFELGAYLPFARGHSEKSAGCKEPWAFGPKIEAVVRSALQRRMQLLPYLYTLFHKAASTGMPIARPLFFADPADERLRAIDDAFLLGDALLVAPIVQASSNGREVVLPGGVWHPFPQRGAAIRAKSTIAHAPLGTTPVFARGGSIVCTGPPVEHTAPAHSGPLDVHVFLDEHGNAAGELYEDEGEGRAHRRGAWRTTAFTARTEKGEVLVDARERGELERRSRERRVHVHRAS